MKILKFKLCALSVLMATLTIAQPEPHGNKKKKEAIEKEKIAFISTRVDLTVEEAQVFWPIYNDFNKQMEKTRKAFDAKRKEIIGDKEIDALNDTDFEKLINLEFEKKAAMLENEKANYENLKKVLPISKIAKYFKAEDDFRRILMQKLKGAVHPPSSGSRKITHNKNAKK